MMRSVDPGHQAPLTLIAGNGTIPLQVLDALERQGRRSHVVAIRGEAASDILDRADAVLSWGEIGRLFKFLRHSGSHEIMLIGGVSKRPDFTSIIGDLGTMRRLPRIIKAVTGGDDSLLTKVIGIFETEGFSVVGIGDVVPEILIGDGTIGAVAPSDKAHADIALAYQAAHRLGGLDIGQAAVAVGGRVIALEGAEGTDSMLERCAQLVETGRVKSKSGAGVLVKTVKPRQDLRVDLPTIGPRTVELAVKAGLSGIALRAGGALIAERETTIQTADRAGVFLYGFSAEDHEALR